METQGMFAAIWAQNENSFEARHDLQTRWLINGAIKMNARKAQEASK